MRIKLAVGLLCLLMVVTGCHYPGRTTLPSDQIPVITPSPFPQSTPTHPEPPFLEPTPIPDIEAIFTLQEGGPFYLPNFTHPDEGCQWLGVAGQVFDQDDFEVLNLTVIAGNNTGNAVFEHSAVTGSSLAYGLGGFEIQLSNQAVDTSGVYWVQVLDGNGKPLSRPYYFDTLDDCESNLVLVNFVSIENQPAP